MPTQAPCAEESYVQINVIDKGKNEIKKEGRKKGRTEKDRMMERDKYAPACRDCVKMTDYAAMSLRKLWELVLDREAWYAVARGVAKSQT